MSQIEPYVVRHIVGQRSAQNWLMENHGLTPICIEIIGVIYALAENLRAADATAISEVMDNHPKNLLYKPLRKIASLRYVRKIELSDNLKHTKRKKRGFDPAIYSLTEKGTLLLQDYTKLIKHYGIGF